MKQSVIVYLLFFGYVNSAVYRDELKTEIVDGQVRQYCDHNGIRVYPVTSFQDKKKCLDCSCTNDGLQCQTMAGVGSITVPDSAQCISKLIDCKNHWVMRNDDSKDCPPNLIPKHYSMVG